MWKKAGGVYPYVVPKCSPGVRPGKEDTAMTEYQKQQEAARRRQERRERREVARLRHQLKQDAAGKLDKLALAGAQEKLQETLNEERETFLGRDEYERVAPEEFRGYRNGQGEPRPVHLGGGSVAVTMPRVAKSPEPFHSGILPPYQRTSPKLLETLPQLYLYGISTGDFRAALECLVGADAALSPASIARLKERWYLEYERWCNEPLASHYAYIWADGIYLKVGDNKEKLAVLVVMGVDVEGRKRILVMMPGQRESYEQWREVLRDLRRRGVSWVGLAVADGIPGFWRAVGEVFPDARRQRCWVHMMRNVLDKLPQAKQDQAHADLLRVYNAETRAQAVKWLAYFADNYHGYPSAVRCLLENQTDLLGYFDFPKEHWRHLKTTNPVESPFASVKSRIRRAKRLLRHWSALGLVYQLLMDQQTRWFRLTAANLAADVVAGARYQDGVRVK
jgi:transposase-like protein